MVIVPYDIGTNESSDKVRLETANEDKWDASRHFVLTGLACFVSRCYREPVSRFGKKAENDEEGEKQLGLRN
jgi:hypothetical protein